MVTKRITVYNKNTCHNAIIATIKTTNDNVMQYKVLKQCHSNNKTMKPQCKPRLDNKLKI